MLNFFIFSGLWDLIRKAPPSTTAFNFFEPITAPRPDLAAILPRSLEIPDIKESFSPAGPMHATRGFLQGACFISAFSVSTVSIPQNREASLISALPLSTKR